MNHYGVKKGGEGSDPTLLEMVYTVHLIIFSNFNAVACSMWFNIGVIIRPLLSR